MRVSRFVILGLGAIILVAFPFVVSQTFFVYIGVLTAIYLILALSYDLVVGRVGAISLAQPAFYGIGAYSAGILSTRYESPFLLNLLLGAFLAGVFAFVIGIPSFKMADYTFAMGTLGMTLVAQLVATNWYDVTRGPVCLSGVPPISLQVPGLFTWVAEEQSEYYFVAVILALIVTLVVHRIVGSRVGRAFAAIREDPLLAESRGIHLLRYRLMAFTLSAVLASTAGVLFAHFIKVVCPTLLDVDISLTLLIIVFLGGVGNIGGIIAGAIIFTLVPEYLRITPQAKPLIYGTFLLLIMIYAPDGLAGLVQKNSLRFKRFFDKSEKKSATTGTLGGKDEDAETLRR